MPTQLTILLDNPSAVYFPGNLVSGTAILEVFEKPSAARTIKIGIDGRAHTSWTVDETVDDHNSDGTTTSRTVSHHFHADVVYMKGSSLVWSKATTGCSELAVGQHHFKFEFQLPMLCAPSIECSYGYIRYHIDAVVDRSWKFNKKAKRIFSVLPHFDLNSIPHAIQPLTHQRVKDTGSFLLRRGLVKITCTLPKTGFVPGETITILAEVENSSKKPVIKVSAHLFRITKFVGYEGGRDFPTCEPFIGHEKLWSDQKRTERREVTCISTPMGFALQPGKQQSVQLKLRVPATAPSFNCTAIIANEYFIKVCAQSTTTFNSEVKVSMPMLIGTIPINPATPVPPSPGFVQPGGPSSSGAQAPPLPKKGEEEIPQALAPPALPTAPMPPPYPQDAPPSYEQAVGGQMTLRDADDNQSFAPLYPVFNNAAQVQLPSAPPAYR